MSRAEARDFLFKYVLPFLDGEDANMLTAMPGTVRGIEQVASGAGSVPRVFREQAESRLAARRAAQASATPPMAALLDTAMAWYMKEIGSPHVDGANLVDRSGACFDLRASMIANSEWVAPIGQVLASDPAAGDGLILRRLTVDHTGQAIEGGRRELVTFEVTQTAITGAGARTVRGVLYGDTGPDDFLDRDGGTARNSDIEMACFNEVQRGAIQNSTFPLIGAPANGTTIPLDQSVLGAPWVQSTPTSTATCVVRTTNPWRSKTNGIALSGQNTDRRFTQPLVVPSAAEGAPNAYTPIDWLTVINWDGTWEGTVTVGWGNKTQAFPSSGFSGAGFKYLVPPLDKNLYPVNFTTTNPTFYVNVETTSASGEIVLHYADVQRMQPRQGFFYSAWSHTDDPAEATKKTWADACAFTGKLARAFAKAYEYEPYAYLVTDSSIVASPPGTEQVAATLSPTITGEYNGAVLNDGGTIALGSVPVGAHAVRVRFRNTGQAALGLGIPTQGSATNATLTDPGLTAPAAIPANTDEYLDIDFEVTSSGAGAFSCVINVSNNDPGTGKNPFNFTVSGTAT